MTDSPARRIPDNAFLALACLGQFMVVLDVSVVNVALPSMRNDLGFSGTGLQWVVSAYTITFAGFLLLGGRAADLFGQRRVFSAGLALFTLSSLGGGFAQSPGMLVASRAVQGVGSAIMAPATLTILTTTFTGQARARALGIWSAVAGAAGAAGALVGGVLTDAAGWRWTLFVNVPVGVGALVAARVVLRDRNVVPGRGRSLDVAGALLVTAGLATLVYGIVQSDSHGWVSVATDGPILVGAGLLAAFIRYEGAGATAPLLPLRLVRSRRLVVSVTAMLFLSAGITSSWYFQSLYMQNVLHWSPLRTGFAFLPQTVTIFFSAQFASRLVGRLGTRGMLLLGGLCTTVGLAGFGFLPVNGGAPYLLVPQLLAGLGLGLTSSPIVLAATAGVAHEDAGIVSGVVTTMRQVGASVGLALLATVAVDRTAALGRRGDGTLPSLLGGYDTAFRVSAGFAVMVMIMGLLIPRLSRPAPVEAQAVERAGAAA